ncbi:class I SAM-dependent methyltransferase [Flectobacillus major]|uniref:class I SAM-dependent methyltransferase n=1 Tax=Flectobacillus major TaxID=103 RepID=UPI00047E0D26|nr:methyltransferase domain-containing protein [Flectobacillus major]
MIRLGHNFNLVAPIYDKLSRMVFGQKLQEAQQYWLSVLPKNKHILIVGGGTGWILEAVIQACSPAHIVYLEVSSSMIAMSQKRLQNTFYECTIQYIEGDETALSADMLFDIVITPFVLDLFSDSVLQQHFIPTLKKHLYPDSYWLHTDFFATVHPFQQILAKIMYGFFSVVSGVKNTQLPDYQYALSKESLILLHDITFLNGFVRSQLWQLK